MTSHNLGVLASTGGDLRAALRFYHASLADYRALGLSGEMLRALNNLGMLYKDLERWDAAQRSFAEAVEIGTLCGDVSALITAHLNVASMWIARGDMTRAGPRRARKRIKSRRRSTIIMPTASGRASPASLRANATRTPRANSVSAARSTSPWHTPTCRSEADAARELAELYRRQGRNRDALQALARAHRLFSQLRSRREVADIERRNAKLEAEFLAVVHKWGESIEAKDFYTRGHCERVSDLSCALAARCRRPARRRSTWIPHRRGAARRCGKLVVPSEILNKPGPLSAAEWDVIRKHPNAGVALLSDVDVPGDVIPIIKSHHERWGGGRFTPTTFPAKRFRSRRASSASPSVQATRSTSERSYRDARTRILEAMEIMRRDVGRRYDPALFEQFESLMQQSKAPPCVPAHRVSRRRARSPPYRSPKRPTISRASSRAGPSSKS